MVEIDEKQVFSILQRAKESGQIKIGINEVTKAIERKQTKLVIYANDVSPVEIVAHLKGLSKEMGVVCLNIGTREELGSTAKIKSTTAIGVVDAGSGNEELDLLIKDLKKNEVPKTENVVVEKKQKEEVKNVEDNEKIKEKPIEKKEEKPEEKTEE